VVISVFGISGCLVFFLRLPGAELLLEAALYVGICAALVCLVRLYIALGRESLLDEEQRRSFRKSVLLLGPAGALEVFLALRGVSSKRAG
jgi:hypothetical protein